MSVLDGLDALLSIVQMPPGVPVATVGVDNAKNATLSRYASWPVKRLAGLATGQAHRSEGHPTSL